MIRPADEESMFIPQVGEAPRRASVAAAAGGWFAQHHALPRTQPRGASYSSSERVVGGLEETITARRVARGWKPRLGVCRELRREDTVTHGQEKRLGRSPFTTLRRRPAVIPHAPRPAPCPRPPLPSFPW